MYTCFSEGFQHYWSTVVCASWRQGSAEQVYLFSMLSLSRQHDFIQGGINGLVMESHNAASQRPVCLGNSRYFWETLEVIRWLQENPRSYRALLVCSSNLYLDTSKNSCLPLVSADLGVWVQWMFGRQGWSNTGDLVISGDYFLSDNIKQNRVFSCPACGSRCVCGNRKYPHGRWGGSAESAEGAFLTRHNHSSSYSWSFKITWHFLQEEKMSSVRVEFLLDQLLCFCLDFLLSLSAAGTFLLFFLSWDFANIVL